jgi:hypothetical protein
MSKGCPFFVLPADDFLSATSRRTSQATFGSGRTILTAENVTERRWSSPRSIKPSIPRRPSAAEVSRDGGDVGNASTNAAKGLGGLLALALHVQTQTREALQQAGDELGAGLGEEFLGVGDIPTDVGLHSEGALTVDAMDA